jgi:hypothetical protein
LTNKTGFAILKSRKGKEIKKMTINNKPEYANEYEYIVARKIDNEYWFYGAYADELKAYKVANEINGIVFHNTKI